MATLALRMWFILALTAMMVPSLILMPEGADAAGEIAVSVNIDGEDPKVEVGPGTDGVMTYTGTVAITQSVDVQWQTAVVELVVNSGTFQATEIPPIIIFTQSREARFAFSIQIPPGTPCSDILGDQVFSVTGTWSYEPGAVTGDVSPYDFVLDIEPYYLYRIESPQQYVQTSPGGEFGLDLVVANEGNTNDRIQIDLLNREDLDKAGWSVQYDVSTFPLLYGEEKTIELYVTTPVKWKGYKNTVTPIRFAITSTIAVIDHDKPEVVYYTIFVRERGVSVPGFEVPLVLAAMVLALMVQLTRRRVR